MTEAPKLSAKDVTINLYWALRGASQILIPRYTPKQWWECDLWRLTKSDFVDEYEIKLSVADFRADMAKSESRYEIDPTTRRYTKMPDANKHQLLATDQRGPNRFWFVVPSEIENKIVVPDYAGLMVFHRSHPVVRKQAPKRHGRKWEGDKLKVYSTFYHRFWTHEARIKDGFTPSEEPIYGLDGDVQIDHPNLL